MPRRSDQPAPPPPPHWKEKKPPPLWPTQQLADPSRDQQALWVGAGPGGGGGVSVFPGSLPSAPQHHPREWPRSREEALPYRLRRVNGTRWKRARRQLARSPPAPRGVRGIHTAWLAGWLAERGGCGGRPSLRREPRSRRLKRFWTGGWLGVCAARLQFGGCRWRLLVEQWVFGAITRQARHPWEA